MIVLLEHHEDTRDLYSDYLRHCGFNVVAAVTTDDAFDQARAAAAIVTGIGVRGSLDGLGLIARLRDSARTRRVPILVVTAHAFDDVRAQAMSAGADAFLPKPCFPETLDRELRRVLRMPPPTRRWSERRRIAHDR
jgi:CheY-like chemotaxis protein